MATTTKQKGLEELRQARARSRHLYWFVAVFSFFVNLLMLTGPLYMLQVYDRVLGSGSRETLFALSLLVAFLFGLMGLLDFARGRVMARVGARFQDSLDRRVFDAALRRSTAGKSTSAQTALQDLESVQRLLTSPVLTALFDMPWAPVFFVGISLFHPWLGLLAIFGGSILIIAAILNQVVTKRPTERMMALTHQASRVSGQLQAEAEMVSALGMREAAYARWKGMRNQSLEETISASDLGGGFTISIKTFRLFLQSAMLGLGAYLVLEGELTPGAMIAGSILLGRALAPIELAVNQWAVVQRARTGWSDLAELLGEIPEELPRTRLPDPKAHMQIQQITVVPPGESQATLRMISFDVLPGEAIGVIGSSGAGKSTLAKALCGVWRPAGGKIRLDGASLEQYDPSALGRYIGYLPQRVELFDGTIADNISRLQSNVDPEKIIAAAKRADAHQMILKLPEGYETLVSAHGGRLSGGQIQRIGLARAMFETPAVLVLDEPNSNLDNEGSQALNTAIRSMKAEGKSVLIMAHRPAAIQECDKLLVLDGGMKRAFGPKDEVLKEVLQNHGDIRNSKGPGGVQ